MDDDDGPRTAQPPAVTYPAIMRAYLRGDAPGTITPVKVDNWHAAAVKLHDAITRHGLGAVVFPQTADKSPLAKYEGPRDNCKWPAADALRAYEWRNAGGLGLLIYSDMIVLDFDKMDVKQERVDYFVSCLQWMEAAPREVSGGGVHVFFESTELSRAVFPGKSKAPDIDIITVNRTGTGHNLNVAPSGNKRWVVGCSIFDAAPPPIPDALVRHLNDACVQMKAEGAARATGKERTGVKRKSPPSDSLERRRPVARQSDRGNEGWLSRSGDALGAKLFSLAGLDDCAPARFGNGWYSRSERPCPFPDCGIVHTNNYCIGLNKFGSVIFNSLNKDAHYPESTVVELDSEALRAMQDAWAVANAGATDLVRGDGCFYKTAVASGGERVTWRVFMPWEERDGGRCLNAVPNELWAASGESTTIDVAAVLAEVERADHLKLGVSAFIGEFGPSKSGKTLCGFEFTSKDACFICRKVHGGAEPYRVALVKSGERILIYAPCSNGADAWRYPVFKEAERARGPTNAELLSTWAADEGAGAASGAAASQIMFKDALLRIVASVTWAEKLEAATDALDVANGKAAGTSAHYRATMSEPTRNGRPGQPRVVVRIEYTLAGGFKLYTFYANSGKTFNVKPTGSAGETRLDGVPEFCFEKP